MLTNITLGQYFPGQSFLHLLDPRSKIVGTIILISAIFLAESYLGYTAVILFATVTVLVSGIPIRFVLRSIRPLWIIIVLTLVFHVFMTPGTIISTAGPLVITKEGLHQGALMTVRLVLLVMVSSILTLTTSPLALTDGIERLLKPFKRLGLPAHELAMMMTIALRFIPTLLEETDRIMKAQMARGADFSSGNVLRRVKNMVPLLVPLFISAFRRADELATAMEARCYHGGDNRTRMKVLKFAFRDLVAGTVLILLITIIFTLRY